MTDLQTKYAAALDALQDLAEASLDEMAQEIPEAELLARRMLRVGEARLRLVANFTAGQQPNMRVLLDPLNGEPAAQPVEIANFSCPPLYVVGDLDAIAKCFWFFKPLRAIHENKKRAH
jgi:hypothetical protein